MPRKEAIEKRRKQVEEILSKRYTQGKVKCSWKYCQVDKDLEVHHRYKPELKRGDQYSRLGSCLDNPDNCELLCKYHHDKSDAFLQARISEDEVTQKIQGRRDEESREDYIKRAVKEWREQEEEKERPLDEDC